jgi:hypothetical protein
MNKTIKEQLAKMENRLNEALDNDLFNDPEFDMDEFQSEVCSFESELNDRSYRERFAFQGEANPVTLRLLRKMNLSSGKILIS